MITSRIDFQKGDLIPAGLPPSNSVVVIINPEPRRRPSLVSRVAARLIVAALLAVTHKLLAIAGALATWQRHPSA